MYTNIAKNQAPNKNKIIDEVIRKTDLNADGLYELLTDHAATKRERVIAYIIHQLLFYKNRFYESEITIAERMKVSRRQVSRVIQKLLSLGVIARKRRINTSNMYTINPEMKTPSIVERFGGLIPSLRGILHLSLLLSLTVGMTWCQKRPEKPIAENVSQYLNNDLDSIKFLTSYTPSDGCKGKKLISKESTKDRIPQDPVKVRRNIVEHYKVRELYPMLDEYGQCLAVIGHMSPYEACYLALYTKEILLSSFVIVMANTEYLKTKIKNPKAYVIGIINKVSSTCGYKPDITFLESIRDHFKVDSTWRNLSYQEHSLLMQRLKKYFEDYRHLQGQCLQTRKETFKDKEQQQAQERILKARTNSHSVYYTGPVLDQRESLKQTYASINRSSSLKKESSSEPPQIILPQPPKAPKFESSKGNIFLDMFPVPEFMK